jgi:hypothetical protein
MVEALVFIANYQRIYKRMFNETKKGKWQVSYRVRCQTKSHVVTNHHHKHQGLDPLIHSVSRFTAALANDSSVFQLFSFLVVCSGMISRGFGFVAFFASVKTSSVCSNLSLNSKDNIKRDLSTLLQYV